MRTSAAVPDIIVVEEKRIDPNRTVSGKGRTKIMNEVIKNMADRRSIRSYSKEPIPRDVLEQIVEAGYYSPNAGNKQLLKMVVCEDAAINERLGKLRALVTGKFWWPEEGEEFTFSDEELDACDKDDSFYGAPCVIYLFSKADFEFAEGDAYIMANDLCLAARSFDIGSCVISVATDYFLVDSAKQILKDWGIPEDYRIFAHATIGYPEGGFPEAPAHDLYSDPLWVK